MTTDTPTVGKIEYAPDYQSRQAVVPVADIEATATKIARLEGDLRECVELLKMARHRIYDELGTVKNGYIQKVDSLLARLQESKTL